MLVAQALPKIVRAMLAGSVEKVCALPHLDSVAVLPIISLSWLLLRLRGILALA